jgi:hypothetical protein
MVFSRAKIIEMLQFNDKKEDSIGLLLLDFWCNARIDA